MSAAATVLWPPELQLQPALFLPDRRRVRAVQALRCAGVAVVVASGAHTAAACVDALVAAGIARVQLGGSEHDEPARAVLRAACARRGVAVDDAIAAMQVVVGEPDVVAFAHAEVQLPRWVRAVRRDGVDGAGTLHAIAIERTQPVAALVAAARQLVGQVGAARVRLAVEPGPALFATRALAALHEPALRERLLAVAAAALPHFAPLLATACTWCDVDVDPLLQGWAGNGLAERNRDLLVNIVP